MGIGRDFLDECNDTAQWEKLKSRDGYGKPSFILQGTYPSRYIRKNRKVRTREGQEVVSTAHLWMLPSVTSGDPFPLVSPDDRVVLSDGKTPQIAAVEVFEDEVTATQGPTHTVVYFL